MKKALTDKFIRSISPGSSRQEFADTVAPGLALRVGPRSRTWVYVYKDMTGRVRRHKFGTLDSHTLAEAREAARELRRRVQRGGDPTAERAHARAATFEKLASEYLEKHAKPRKKSWRNDERILNKHLLPYWTGRPVSEITRRDVRERLESIATTAPTQANRVRALCSRLFNFALERDWVAVSPVMGLPAPSMERSRDRFLSSDEVGAFWRALRTAEASGQVAPSHADQLRLRLLLGQRASEIAAMRWEDINRVDSVWTQPNTKSGRPHVLPVTRALEDVLERQRCVVPVGCPWVFPNTTLTGPDIHRTWRSAGGRVGSNRKQSSTGLAAFGIQNAKGHDLRRTCATHLARLGHPPHLIGRLLNHAGALGPVTQIYNRHAYLPELAQALEQWHDEVLRLAAAPAGQPARSTAGATRE